MPNRLDDRPESDPPPGQESTDDERLEIFSARLKRARNEAGLEPKPETEAGAQGPSMLGIAMRLSTELVAAVIVGVGIGILIDRLLGTSPWGLMIMFLLGSAAGLLNVVRAAKRLNEQSAALLQQQPAPPPANVAGDEEDGDNQEGRP